MFPNITTPPAATSTSPSHVYCASDERRYVLTSVKAKDGEMVEDRYIV